MKSNVTNTDSGTATSEIPSPIVFRALSHRRRQYALQYLVQRPGAVALGDLAEYIAIEEGTVTRDRYERILTGLYHTHLPHLSDAGFVWYDLEREVVDLCVEPRALAPYLELALPSTHE
ncbi:DUF7344 domain-containing protein [Natrononativus amylolyticus]|uniref:DUF7344 domain-containing protein n=1 Tax=Natrononativus amylolyticus TaxID=2963434 RepID=UPI0020CF77AB|nr:hypothetical protein [Natrononativus amylolyticus]